jgi:lipopolysaccharide export system protein LptC
MKGSRITSDAMTVLENGRVVVFDRRVRMNIDAGQVKSAQQQGSGGINASN